MRYWYSPLKPDDENLFTTPDNYFNKDHLYTGELKKEVYDRIVKQRAELDEDEFGLPLTDEFGLPL